MAEKEETDTLKKSTLLPPFPIQTIYHHPYNTSTRHISIPRPPNPASLSHPNPIVLGPDTRALALSGTLRLHPPIAICAGGAVAILRLAVRRLRPRLVVVADVIPGRVVVTGTVYFAVRTGGSTAHGEFVGGGVLVVFFFEGGGWMGGGAAVRF